LIGGQRHELVGIDAAGELCSCGVKDPAFVEHLADVLTPLFGVARYTTVGYGNRHPEAPRVTGRVA
jgi:hypothetical protein